MNNKIKLYIFSLINIFLSFKTAFWESTTIRDLGSTTILDWINNAVWANVTVISDLSETNGFNLLSSLFKWFKWELFSVVMVLSVWVFIFIGIKLATSKWNPEEFKKAMTHFVYSIVWIFFIFMAWWIVKLVSSLSF